MNNQYFITGIGTDVGKTYLLTNLIAELLLKNYSVAACKPIVSGVDRNNLEESDSYKIISSMAIKNISFADLQSISPFIFEHPLSPDQAAKLEGKAISYPDVIDFTRNFLNKNIDKDYSFIEGVGGVFVPINQDKLVLDLIKDLDLKIILAANNYLGCLNHTLLTLEALKDFDVIIYFNNYPALTNFDANLTSLRSFTNCPIFTNIKDLLDNIRT